jgi:homoserine O-succinyltransferase/O-acetyltransferase
MPLLLDTGRSGAAVEFRAANCITVGLVNNMPDAAHEATERQFAGLISVAAADVVVCLKLFSIPAVPRTDAARRSIEGRYHDVSELWDAQLDGLIVTGTEPRANRLNDEPYWQTLTRVVDWARENTASTIWSCLAAHAAVLHADGIERCPLAEKLYGVFACEPADAHPMTSDAGPGLRVPHSRYNGLPERPLASAGYRILTRSLVAGVDMFARQDKSFHLFLQGHPEYEVTTLLREYRRDIGRFLRREREAYPVLPQGYFSDRATAIANGFRSRALADRDERMFDDFPISALQAGLEFPWRLCAVGIYGKWLEYLRGRKAEGRPPGVPLRRAWRDWPSSVARPAVDSSARS